MKKGGDERKHNRRDGSCQKAVNFKPGNDSRGQHQKKDVHHKRGNTKRQKRQGECNYLDNGPDESVDDSDDDCGDNGGCEVANKKSGDNKLNYEKCDSVNNKPHY